MKKGLLIAALGLSCAMSFTSCDKDNKEPVINPTNEVYTMANPTNTAELDKIKAEFAAIKAGEYDKVPVADAAKANIKKWAEEYAQVKVLENVAEEGKAGYLIQMSKDKEKKRYVTAKAVEPNQLIAKGFIGAYQLKNFNKTVVAAMNVKTAKERAEALNKCVVYLLGDLKFGKTKDEFNAEGNSFGKYLMSISTKDGGKYFGLAKELEAEITKAYTLVNDPAKFTASLSQIGTYANIVTAFRGVHYIAGFTNKLRQENGMNGENVHELSEGLGFVYSLQFAYKFNSKQHGQYYLSAEDANAAADVDLWAEAKDKSGASLLDKLSSKIADQFDFTVEDAVL